MKSFFDFFNPDVMINFASKFRSFMKSKLLIIDNFDSFTYNLYQQILSHYDGIVDVIRNDEITLQEIEDKNYEALIISPGPKTPKESGISQDAIVKFSGEMPILGICLGMQCINEVFGGITTESNFPVHGKVTQISHSNTGLFQGIKKEIDVARYHSLKIANIPDCLEVCSMTVDNIPMGITHKELPIFGLQFHPESFLTDCGDELIKNFLKYV